MAGGLIARYWVVRELAPIRLGSLFREGPHQKKLARPCRTSQAAAGAKREHNWGLEERIRTKEIKKRNYIDKILIDAIVMPSTSYGTFIIWAWVVFPDLESCFQRNKGLRNKIKIDLNPPEISRARRSDHTRLVF
jgi:hypothetical protein